MDFGTNVEAPPDRNFASELAQTAQGFLQTAPDFYNLEKKYEPLYQKLQLELQQGNLLGYDQDGQHQPGTLELTSAQRLHDIMDVANLGPAARAAALRANPELAATLQKIMGATGRSPILSELNDQAMAELRSNGELSPETLRRIQQDTRSRFSTGGMAHGNAALVSEIMNQEQARSGRIAASRAFGAGVEGMNQQQNNYLNNAASVFSSTLDPYLTITGRPSTAGTLPVSRLYNPTDPYAADLYNTNYNADASARMNNANNSAALWGAAIKTTGQIAGAAAGASDRRIKKDIRATGEKTPSGLKLYKFRYRTDRKSKVANRKFIGPMAQDVQKKFPGAVSTVPFKRAGSRIRNLKVVDFSKIDAPFQFAA